MWSVDEKGRMVEEIHHPDGRTEILVHMGHSIEESSIGEKIGNMVRLLILWRNGKKDKIPSEKRGEIDGDN